MNKVAVIGIGNPWRGDDAVGIVTARNVKLALNSSIAIVESEGEVTSLIECFKNFDRVYVIDAIKTGNAEPGHVFCFDGITKPLQDATLRASTHVLGIAQSIEMARVLGHLPSVLRIFGIEAAQFEHGTPLSEKVNAASQIVARQVIQEINKEIQTHA